MTIHGVHVANASVPELVAVAQHAEAAGVSTLWLTSGLGPDSLTSLAVVGARTERIRLGTAIAIAYSRHPLAMIQQARAIEDVAPGRLRLGIGHPGVKAEVINWVLKKPSPEHRTAIEECIARTLKAVPAMLAGEMDKATLIVHTHKPPRPKPPRPEGT